MIVFFATRLDWSKASPGSYGLSAIVAAVSDAAWRGRRAERGNILANLKGATSIDEREESALATDS